MYHLWWLEGEALRVKVLNNITEVNHERILYKTPFKSYNSAHSGEILREDVLPALGFLLSVKLHED